MKSVLVTGASSGFGLGVSIELARRGWRVFAAMRNLEKRAALDAKAAEAGVSDRIELVELDVTVPASVERGVAETLAKAGGALDAVLNNAGYSILGAFEDLSDEACRQQMDTNFFGVLAVTRAVLPSMRAAGRGRIVIVTSNAVNSPHPLLTMYAASKWALEGWAEGLAMEIEPFGLEVALLQPGAHRTEFASNVEFLAAENGPYAAWIAEAMPGIAKLDEWGRSPALAIGPIADAVTSERVAFRQQVGEDSKVFAALKGAAPFETRALLLRAICGLPGPGAYCATGAETPDLAYPVLTDVLGVALDRAGKDPALAAMLARSFGLPAAAHADG